ncbi:GAF domain-containing protein [Leptothermofonsia sichuanensis]|uniref:GAF domain-containing protein n=1 Tax=Leptothermofonsia sichuanensis TaxID=2917832 RepID=UPI001CED4859|nr:GAF domain-containing protein [Leptothermofonsia sichuanensis]
MTSKSRKSESGATLMQGDILNRMTNRIRRSLELQEILTATVAEVRSFLGTDRVKIYRFEPDGSGQVIAESIRDHRLPPLLNLRFPSGDIPPHAREMFIKARQRVIVDIPGQVATLSRLENPLTTADLTVEAVNQLALEEILQRPVDPCHVEYLKAMGVQSSLVVPILHHQELWGLLVSHHAQPKRFSKQKLQMVQWVADQVSIAIAQSILLHNARERARREALINQITTLLHAPLSMNAILQFVLEAVVGAVQGSSGRLYLLDLESSIPPQLCTCGRQPEVLADQTLLEETRFWQDLMNQEKSPSQWVQEPFTTWELPLKPEINQELSSLQGSYRFNPLAVSDIYQEPRLAEVLPAFHATPIRSLLVMPLKYGDDPLGYLTIFRDEVDTDILWAGRFDPDERNDRPRQSFEVWRELKRGQAQQWLPEELDLVRSLGTHLTMAVMQNRLYQCEREHRLLVEMRNQELNTARTAAEEASQLKSDFLSSTSHELRTPLASTLNYLKLLKEGFYDNPEELQEYIDVAYHSAENLVAIINDVLDIAKIEAGRMPVHLESVNLREMLREQEILFKPESQQKGIPLIIDCQVEQVQADAIKLRQVLTNLLANAFKFTDTGEIHVRAVQRSQDRYGHLPPVVEISVIDTGIGIDSNRGDLLFEPFVQADGSIKRRYGGTGLGLTVCKRLVELMGGKIWLESSGRGQGTTVTFTLSTAPDVVHGT